MKQMMFLILPLFFLEFVQANEMFAPMNKLLSAYVKENPVSKGGLETSFDYMSAKKDPSIETLIDQQTRNFAKFDTTTLKSKAEATAFWINAYNFFMLKKILKDGFKKGKLKIDGVKSFGSLFNPYRVFKQEDFQIGGKKYSLDGIEKGILLGEDYKKKGWKDARIHFAVNCASVGCPPLLAKAYDAKSVNQVLDENVKRALKTPRHMNLKNGKMFLTHLFKWYKDDFKEQEGSVKKFIKKYVAADLHAQIDKAEVDYIEYDWNLNKPGNFKKRP